MCYNGSHCIMSDTTSIMVDILIPYHKTYMVWLLDILGINGCRKDRNCSIWQLPRSIHQRPSEAQSWQLRARDVHGSTVASIKWPSSQVWAGSWREYNGWVDTETIADHHVHYGVVITQCIFLTMILQHTRPCGRDLGYIFSIQILANDLPSSVWCGIHTKLTS